VGRDRSVAVAGSQTITIEGAKATVEQSYVEGSFAAFVVQKRNGWRALVFRGSEDGDLGDWIDTNLRSATSGLGSTPPMQYLMARAVARAQDPKTILVGHSLGGGLAMYAAAQWGMAAATIYPAPIQPTWLPGFPPLPAQGTRVQNYVCMGEVLTMAEYASSHVRIGRDVWIEARGNSFDKHLLPNIVVGREVIDQRSAHP